MKKIIAITGLKGSGKDSTADYIVKNYANYEKDSFAATVKDSVSAIFGWDRKMLAGETPYDRELREKKDEFWSEKLGYDVTPRIAMQKIGTDTLRNHFDKNIWIYSLEHRLLNSDKNIIITDCRFKNEIDALKKHNALFIRVERNPLPTWFRDVEKLNLDGYQSDAVAELVPEIKQIHSSEWDWIGYDKPDYILNVNGDFEYLYNQIRQIKEL